MTPQSRNRHCSTARPCCAPSRPRGRIAFAGSAAARPSRRRSGARGGCQGAAPGCGRSRPCIDPCLCGRCPQNTQRPAKRSIGNQTVWNQCPGWWLGPGPWWLRPGRPCRTPSCRTSAVARPSRGSVCWPCGRSRGPRQNCPPRPGRVRARRKRRCSSRLLRSGPSRW